MSNTDNKIDTNQNVDTPSTNKDTDEPINKSIDESINKDIDEAIKQNIDEVIPDSVDIKISDVTGNVLTTSNMFMLLWFLAIYIVMYYVLGMFFNKGGEPGEFQKNLGRTLDFIFFISLLVFCI